MPKPHSQDSAHSVEADAVTESLPRVEESANSSQFEENSSPGSDDATETLALADGYEYVTEENGSRQALVDPDDNSLALGLMKNGDEVEKLTRQERKADRYAERMAARERADTQQMGHEGPSQELALDRDTLAAVPPCPSKSRRSGAGSKVFFAGSAVLTTLAAVITASFLVSSQQQTPQPVSEPSLPPSSASSTVAPSASSITPTPSFNTQQPTVTVKENEPPLTPGTVQYAPTLAPAEVLTNPIPSADQNEPAPLISVEPAPTVEEEIKVKPSESPSAPAALVAPSDARPVDEPDRPIETADPGDDTGDLVKEPKVAPSVAPVEPPVASDRASEPAVGALP